MKKIPLFACFLLTLAAGHLAAQSIYDPIGVLLMNTETTNVNGAGVRVAQVEEDYGASGAFEVNPGYNAVFQPTNLFEYFAGETPYTVETSTTFPNSIGAESTHADGVAQVFYGHWQNVTVATNVAHVDNYESSAFVEFSDLAVNLPLSNINDAVVNQSFTLTGSTTSVQKLSDTAYDNYAMEYGVLFVSSAGNGGQVAPPSTCYNGLSVGAYIVPSSYGPTADNGRAKPDLMGFDADTSLTSGMVASAAAALIQAGLRGDGGGATNAAANICTVKALLINGAIKPVGWTNVPPSPLSTNFGAGMLNEYESYMQLTGGKHVFGAASSVAAGAAHPPTGATNTVPSLRGWDFNTNTSSSADDVINHYYFNVTNGVATTFDATATLVWNRRQGESSINNLKLFLYNTANSNLWAASVSTVDNVQHVWAPRLPAGRYDLQVWKAGGSGIVSAAEPYALAYEFVTSELSISNSGSTFTLSWPVYPAGYGLASATNMATPLASWNTNYPNLVINGAQNQITLPATNIPEFFELVRFSNPPAN